MAGSRLEAAQIETVPVTRQKLVDQRFVPGRLKYDDNFHVEVKAPSEGVLSEVLVKPGDRVEVGQILAWLQSSEIGTARANVLKNEAPGGFCRQQLAAAGGRDRQHRGRAADRRVGHSQAQA